MKNNMNIEKSFPPDGSSNGSSIEKERETRIKAFDEYLKILQALLEQNFKENIPQNLSKFMDFKIDPENFDSMEIEQLIRKAEIFIEERGIKIERTEKIKKILQPKKELIY